MPRCSTPTGGRGRRRGKKARNALHQLHTTVHNAQWITAHLHLIFAARSAIVAAARYRLELGGPGGSIGTIVIDAVPVLDQTIWHRPVARRQSAPGPWPLGVDDEAFASRPLQSLWSRQQQLSTTARRSASSSVIARGGSDADAGRSRPASMAVWSRPETGDQDRRAAPWAPPSNEVGRTHARRYPWDRWRTHP